MNLLRLVHLPIAHDGCARSARAPVADDIDKLSTALRCQVKGMDAICRQGSAANHLRLDQYGVHAVREMGFYNNATKKEKIP
jgi:hypothetical protein